MDYFDIVVHVFVPEVREFYRLEQLWGDVPRLDLSSKRYPSTTREAALPRLERCDQALRAP